MFQPKLSHPRPVCTPYPGPCSPEEWEKDRLLPMELDQSDHDGVSTWVQEECCDLFPVPIQGDQYRV